MADLSDIPTAELPALVEQGMPVADYIAEMVRRKAEAMSDLVERLLAEEDRLDNEAAARITELEAEVKRMREALSSIDIYLTDTLTGRVLPDPATYKQWLVDGIREARNRARAALSTPTPPATDPVMAAFHEPRRDLGNGAVPYAPTEEA